MRSKLTGTLCFLVNLISNCLSYSAVEEFLHRNRYLYDPKRGLQRACKFPMKPDTDLKKWAAIEQAKINDETDNGTSVTGSRRRTPPASLRNDFDSPVITPITSTRKKAAKKRKRTKKSETVASSSDEENDSLMSGKSCCIISSIYKYFILQRVSDFN